MESIANILDVLGQPPVSRLAYKGNPKVMSKIGYFILRPLSYTSMNMRRDLSIMIPTSSAYKFTRPR